MFVCSFASVICMYGMTIYEGGSHVSALSISCARIWCFTFSYTRMRFFLVSRKKCLCARCATLTKLSGVEAN